VAHDRIRIVPVFAAEVAWTDPVHLSAEHDRYRFAPIERASELVLWATQRQAHRAFADEVLSGSSGGAAREITARIAALARPRVTVRGGSGRGTNPGARARRSRPASAGPVRRDAPSPARAVDPPWRARASSSPSRRPAAKPRRMKTNSKTTR
jgi:hypothetical protein